MSGIFLGFAWKSLEITNQIGNLYAECRKRTRVKWWFAGNAHWPILLAICLPLLFHYSSSTISSSFSGHSFFWWFLNDFCHYRPAWAKCIYVCTSWPIWLCKSLLWQSPSQPALLGQIDPSLVWWGDSWAETFSINFQFSGLRDAGSGRTKGQTLRFPSSRANNSGYDDHARKRITLDFPTDAWWPLLLLLIFLYSLVRNLKLKLRFNNR